MLFNGSLARPGGVVVQRDPAVVVALPQNLEEPGKIHASGAEALVEIHPVVLLLARRRTFPPMARAVLSLAILEVYGCNSRVVIAKALHRIDAAQGRMRGIEYHI